MHIKNHLIRIKQENYFKLTEKEMRDMMQNLPNKQVSFKLNSIHITGNTGCRPVFILKYKH